MEGKRFTVGEITAATGLGKSTVVYRIKKIGLRRTMDGYTYEDIKRIVDYKPRRGRKSTRRGAEILKKQLQNDGKL
jgi:hypothetical protein